MYTMTRRRRGSRKESEIPYAISTGCRICSHLNSTSEFALWPCSPVAATRPNREPVAFSIGPMGRSTYCRLSHIPSCRSGVSANLLYGFEQFILQSVQSGHVKVTFEREGQHDPLLRRFS